MAKSNAQLQKDKRTKEKALLDRIGAEKRLANFNLKPFIRKAEQPHHLIAYQVYRFHIGFRAHRNHHQVCAECKSIAQFHESRQPARQAYAPRKSQCLYSTA